MKGDAIVEPKVEGEIRVAVCIPNEGHTQVESYCNRLDNFMHLGRLMEQTRWKTPWFNFYFVTYGRIFTPLAREEAAKFTLEIEADYLYMIDDDMICPNDMFERLYKHNVDVVSPLAFTRNFPHKAVMYNVTEGWDSVARIPYFVNHYVDNYPKDCLVETDANGFGAALIKTDVLKGMPEPRFMTSSGTGEDILFCNKAKKAGFRIFMDTSIKLGHLSHPINVTEDYVEKVREQCKWTPPIPVKSKYSPEEAVTVLGD